MLKLILASASPRRSEILSQVNLEFTVMPSECEEIMIGNDPKEIVMGLSFMKAIDVISRVDLEEGGIVIGADTVVASEGKILGKPKDEKDAYDMIHSIQGKDHQVCTGVSIAVSYPKESFTEMGVNLDLEYGFTKMQIDQGNLVFVKTFVEETVVSVYGMTPEEILDYVKTTEPYDKAGGYAIQGLFAEYIKKINGDYYNVVGLPVAKVCEWVKKIRTPKRGL